MAAKIADLFIARELLIFSSCLDSWLLILESIINFISFIAPDNHH